MNAIVTFGIALVMPAVASAATIPSEFRGEWQRARTQCGGAQEDMIVVSRLTLRFYEADFRVRRASRMASRSVVLAGIWSEDGERTATTVRLSLAPDRRRMTMTAWNRKSVVVACRR